MSYKTILACLTSEFAAAHLLPAACGLARQFDAHLTGLHTREALVPYSGIAIASDEIVLGDFNRRVAEEDRKIENLFQAAADQAGCTAEWRSRAARSPDAADELLDSATRCDLIVALLPDRQQERFDQAGFQKDLVVNSGRPVLLLPDDWGSKPVGTRILAAWNGSRESARALQDGLPFLQRAAFAEVVTIQEPHHRSAEFATEGHEIARLLSRHGVTAEVRQIQDTEHPPGIRILMEAASQQCDLVIMGGYGHSRLHRLIFGDASEHVLREARIPVLMSG
ncbi:universal stress protein (plasmid) [Leisingera aquaemixtae]|uniref:universal stress protein n=1 Tax=Leisingera aquaemixtae TaxID=1396826 RepID=UPI0021A7D7DE|nr:universal stress protein [Leisingera aquaemixtae]UWQ27149.1 universal stress protein [Leisingera aquaemixtae]